MKVDNSTTNTGVYETAYTSNRKTDSKKTDRESDQTRVNDTAKPAKSGNYGKTIGDAKLSDEAAKYYEKLKKKYSAMDFILVSKDQKANAQANAGAYANANKMVVLIDEEKIERMATDENYRKQYEGIIRNAASGLSQLKSQIEASGASGNVKGYGMKVDDGGTASFFAVLKKSSADQKARIAKKAAEKKEAKKAAKKEKEEKLHDKKNTADIEEDEDTITITAGSIEELVKKISDYTFEYKSDTMQTEGERQVGQHIDFRG